MQQLIDYALAKTFNTYFNQTLCMKRSCCTNTVNKNINVLNKYAKCKVIVTFSEHPPS